jgi:hypothetical protein
MTNDREMREKEARMKAQMFGTVKLPEKAPGEVPPWEAPLRMPPLEMLRQPFSDPQTVAYLSCNHCGLFMEIDRWLLDRTLDTVNENDTGPVWDETRKAQFDGRTRFIAASGCHRCSPFVCFDVVDIPADLEAGSGAGGVAGHDGERE